MAEVEYSVYFVPVPIGNRADVTLRALDVLRAGGGPTKLAA